jgi:hypothetical protein
MEESKIRRDEIGNYFEYEMVWLKVGWRIKDSKVCGV